MEIPDELKNLYRHWSTHTNPVYEQIAPVELDQQVLTAMCEFIDERMRIWERKTQNLPLPYTHDPILQKYRFCNIYRELDRQTIQIHTKLNPLRDDFPLWLLNVMYERFVCNPDTVEKTGLLSFDERNNEQVFQRLKVLPSPKYGTAYIFPISAIQRSMWPTREKFFCKFLAIAAPKCAAILTSPLLNKERVARAKRETGDVNAPSVSELLEKILPAFGFNFKFHWTEILIDVAYQFPEYVNLYGRFPIGPGSFPTMKRLNLDAQPETVCLYLTQSQTRTLWLLELDGKPVKLSAENWEGIGCEFRKYSNLQKGGGRRRIYH